jgi:hypothetical protein
MPSLPPRDGIDALPCAGIRAGISTISPVDSLSSVAGKSLPPPLTGEHDAIGGPSGISLLPPRVLREHGGGKSPHAAARLLVWVDGTLACYHRGGKAIAELGPSFLADSVFSHPPSSNDGGERRLGGKPCYASQSPAFGICHVYTQSICQRKYRNC